MTTKTTYTCDICGATFTEMELALDCEKHHQTKIIKCTPYHFSKTEETYDEYPSLVAVTFSNGHTKLYGRR